MHTIAHRTSKKWTLVTKKQFSKDNCYVGTINTKPPGWSSRVERLSSPLSLAVSMRSWHPHLLITLNQTSCLHTHSSNNWSMVSTHWRHFLSKFIKCLTAGNAASDERVHLRSRRAWIALHALVSLLHRYVTVLYIEIFFKVMSLHMFYIKIEESLRLTPLQLGYQHEAQLPIEIIQYKGNDTYTKLANTNLYWTHTGEWRREATPPPPGQTLDRHWRDKRTHTTAPLTTGDDHPDQHRATPETESSPKQHRRPPWPPASL
jgi:hypothetical protein